MDLLRFQTTLTDLTVSPIVAFGASRGDLSARGRRFQSSTIWEIVSDLKAPRPGHKNPTVHGACSRLKRASRAPRCVNTMTTGPGPRARRILNRLET